MLMSKMAMFFLAPFCPPPLHWLNVPFSPPFTPSSSFVGNWSTPLVTTLTTLLSPLSSLHISTSFPSSFPIAFLFFPFSTSPTTIFSFLTTNNPNLSGFAVATTKNWTLPTTKAQQHLVRLFKVYTTLHVTSLLSHLYQLLQGMWTTLLLPTTFLQSYPFLPMLRLQSVRLAYLSVQQWPLLSTVQWQKTRPYFSWSTEPTIPSSSKMSRGSSSTTNLPTPWLAT